MRQTAMNWTLHDPADMAAVRHEFAGLLRQIGFDDSTIEDVMLVAAELTTNAIEASDPPGAPVTVRLTIVGPIYDIEVRVRNQGSPFAPEFDAAEWADGDDDPLHGRGMKIVRALSHEVSVESLVGGTMVFARRQVDASHAAPLDHSAVNH